MMRREREIQVEGYQLYIIYLRYLLSFYDKVFTYYVIAMFMELKTM